jgi:DNA-binding MarR family transcriptional regulator
VELGYAERGADAADARRKLVRLTPRGYDVLARSATVFEQLRDEWAEQLGVDGVRAVEANLRAVVPATAIRLDAAGWFGP